MTKRHYISFVFCLLAWACATTSFAQTTPPTGPLLPFDNDNNAFNVILQQFFAITTGYQGTIVAIAEKVFFGLAIFHVFWVGFKLTWNGFEFQKMVAEYMKMLLFLGFFLALLRSPIFAEQIIFSFIQAADVVTSTGAASAANAFDGSGSISPSGLMGTASLISKKAISNISIFKVGAAVLIGISVILIVISFTIIALRLIMAYVEAYIAISAGMILLAFGAMSFTSELAKKYLMYLVSVGMKLFVLLIIVGIAQELMRSLAATWNFNNNDQILLTLSVSIILMGLVMSIPSMIASIVSGQASSGGGEIVSIAGAGAGAAIGAAALKFKAMKGAAGGGGAGGGSAISSAMSVLNKGSKK